MNGKKLEVTAPDSLHGRHQDAAPERHGRWRRWRRSVRIMPKHVLEPALPSGRFASAYSVSTPPESSSTSGPWRLKQYVPGEKTVLEPQPVLVRRGRARSSGCRISTSSCSWSCPIRMPRDLKFRSGEVDGLDNVKPENYQLVRGRPAGQATSRSTTSAPRSTPTSSGSTSTRCASRSAARRSASRTSTPVKYGWFNNPVFRRAVSMADRSRRDDPEHLLRRRASRTGRRRRPATRSGTHADVVRYDYNLDEAKRLLAGLGWTDRNGDGVRRGRARATPISFTLKTNSDNRMRVVMANFIRDDLAKVGIRVTLVPRRLQHAHHQHARGLPVRGDAARPAVGRAARIPAWARTSGARAG